MQQLSTVSTPVPANGAPLSATDRALNAVVANITLLGSACGTSEELIELCEMARDPATAEDCIRQLIDRLAKGGHNGKELAERLRHPDAAFPADDVGALPVEARSSEGGTHGPADSPPGEAAAPADPQLGEGAGCVAPAPAAASTSDGGSPASELQMVAVSSLKTAEPFKGLFEVNAEVLARIVEDMRRNGYDASQAIIVWREEDLVVDGHTRLAAAAQAGLQTIPVVYRSFTDEDAALKYAIHAQHDRRNLTDADILRLVQQLDQRRKRGGDRKSEGLRSKTSLEVLDPSSGSTAKLIGTSPSKVEKARAVISAPDPATKADVAAGRLSLNKGAAKVRAAKKAAKPGRPAAAESPKRKKDLVTACEKLSRAIELVRPHSAELADTINDVLGKVRQLIQVPAS